MWNYRFSLTSGRMVTIAALHVSDTSESVPRVEYEAQFIESARRYGRVLWKEPRSTYVIPPEHQLITEGPHVSTRIPPLVYHARLVCYEAFKGDVISELLVIWFGNPEPHTGLLDIVSRAVKDVPWDEIARPCNP